MCYIFMKYVIFTFLLEPYLTGDNHQINVESKQFEHSYTGYIHRI